MTFFTKVTAPTRATFETLERQHVTWNKGLKLTTEHKTAISKAKQGKKIASMPYFTDEHRAKIAKALGKPVMTPYGLYPSVMAVARASGRNEETVRAWIRKFPEHYYYVNKGE